MSWSNGQVFLEPFDGSDEGAKGAALAKVCENPVNGQDIVEATAARDAAAKSAVGLIASGVYGDPKKHAFSITLSGHAQPDNEPQPGWSRDFASISIQQWDADEARQWQEKYAPKPAPALAA